MHAIEWYTQPEGTDHNGNPFPRKKVHDTVMANVRVVTGSQSTEGDAEQTNETITCLTWYDPRILNSYFVLWESKIYTIKHIKPDEVRKGMIVTCMIDINI